MTLLEVMIASVVLAGAIAVILQCLSHHLSSATRSLHQSHAHRIATNKLNAATGGATRTFPSQGKENHKGVFYRWQVSRQSETEQTSQIVCQVNWKHRRKEHELTLQRLVPSDQQGGADK